MESMPHSLISQTWAMSSPSRPLGKERCLNHSKYSSGRSKMGTPRGGYLSFPNIPKGMEVLWISSKRLRKSSLSISEISNFKIQVSNRMLRKTGLAGWDELGRFGE